MKYSASVAEAPTGWKEAPLEEFVEILDRLRVPLNAEQRANRPGPYAYYGANGQVGTIDDYIFDGDFAILAEDGGHFDDPFRPVAYRVEGRFWVNNHAHIIKTLGQIPTMYLVHFLNSSDLMPFVGGSTRLKLNQAMMRQIPIRLAPLNEQRRIVAKIEDLTARSQAAKQALDAIPPLLERFRQSVLAAAFRGDLTKQWREQNPNVEPASVLLDRIRQERRQRWEQDYLDQQKAKGKTPKDDKWKEKYQQPEPVDTTGLPELPEGWCWANIETLALDGPTNGYSPLSGPDASGPLTLKLSATTSGGLRLSEKNTKRVYEDVPETARFWLEEGDILIQRANTLDYVGTAVVFSGPRMTYIYPDLMMRMRVFNSSLSYFVTSMINSPFCRSFLTSRATGTAGNMPKISGRTVRDLPIPIPPEQEMMTILNVVEQALQNSRQLSDTCKTMEVANDRLNQSILAKAFRGELVPQDPNDEPASALLERIRADRETTMSAGNGKKRKARS